MNRKIRVLFIHSYLTCGGAEQALFDLTQLLDKDKFDVTVVAQYDGGIWDKKFLEAGINLRSFWDCQKSDNRISTKIYNLIKRKKIQRCLKRDGKGIVDVAFPDEFDIIVSYHLNSMHAMGFSQNTKTVKYIHGDVDTNPGYRDIILGAMKYLPQFDKIICVSDNSHKSFSRFSGREENVSTHFNPLNSENIRKMSEADIGLAVNYDVPIMCAVGRLAEEKGYSRLIEIHKKLLDEGIFHRLVIVGDGPERENLENKIKSLQVEDTVILAGYSSNPYPYMKQSKFVVCSSFTEGLPVIAMESLCLGVPIVSAVPSIGEIFGDSECGLITENDDESLANGIRCLLTDPVLYQKTKAAAQERSKFFDGKRMVKEIEDEFIALANQ